MLSGRHYAKGEIGRGCCREMQETCREMQERCRNAAANVQRNAEEAQRDADKVQDMQGSNGHFTLSDFPHRV
jgi:hypothetical protein